MRRAAVLLVTIFALGAALLVVAAVRSSRPIFDESLDVTQLAAFEIAPPGRALTFARRRTEKGYQVLLVTAHQGGHFAALDLNAHFGTSAVDAIELLETRSYDAIRDAAWASDARLGIPESELTLPLAFEGDRHLAAGANFAAHAAEAGIGEPFVFPKRVVPTPWNAVVPKGGARRLDYEVELCLVPLRDIPAAGTPPALGLLLCNDFTDRWSLFFGLAGRDGEMGTRGFGDGKGREGFLPVGSLFVVPRDLERFYPDIELSLWVNGRLRQRSRAGLMIWGPVEIIDQAFARAAWDFEYRGGNTKLLPDGRLPARTLVLSGTPEGVIFRPINFWWPLSYLGVDDQVIAHATHLGQLRNSVGR